VVLGKIEVADSEDIHKQMLVVEADHKQLADYL
jgi:hypothetical protein